MGNALYEIGYEAVESLPEIRSEEKFKERQSIDVDELGRIEAVEARGFRVGVGAHAAHDQQIAAHADVARFDFGFDASGYAWVFPKRDRLSVGILSHGRRPDLHRKVARYLDAHG